MNFDYETIRSQLAEPKEECARLIAQMKQSEITLQNPYSEFFNAYRLIVLQAWDFAQTLEQDPLLKSIPINELRRINNEYYASLDPDEGYDKSLANPDYAHQLYGDALGALISAICTRAYASRRYLISGN